MLDFIPAKEKFLEPGISAAEAQSGSAESDGGDAAVWIAASEFSNRQEAEKCTELSMRSWV
jgi:hypothetical protein